MRVSEFSSSGARVTSLRVSDEVATSPYTSLGEEEVSWNSDSL
jgi:hypothetical protein